MAPDVERIPHNLCYVAEPAWIKAFCYHLTYTIDLRIMIVIWNHLGSLQLRKKPPEPVQGLGSNLLSGSGKLLIRFRRIVYSLPMLADTSFN